MSKQNDALVEILPDIKRAAARTAREWEGVISADDAEQEIALALLADTYAQRVAEMEPGARADVLTRIGTHIASRYRDDYDYFTGNFRYSTREVREILERGALYEERTRTDTERLDLDEGVELLRKRNPRYAELIGRRYLRGEDLPGGTERKELTRAVDLLTNCMNNVHRNRRTGYTEGPGTRKVISRENAAWVTKFQYEGDGRSRGTAGQAVIERAGF